MIVLSYMVRETDPTGRSIKQLLPKVLEQIALVQKNRPDLILAAWPELIGAKFAPMTEAVSFDQGTLKIKVKNATLHSLLMQEKFRLVKSLQEKFPKIEIRNIVFRIG